MADEYALVSRGKLKLKTDSEIKKKKSKKHNKKEKGKIERGAQEELESIKTTAEEHHSQTRHLTKAEVSYKKMQEKMQEKRIMEKASLTHKQRVEKFNEHLDSLTEHFDIPKVSWTK
ncbi:hypothetical protein HA402_006247 [Bradysia odoriphaga]|nr:hypothetical protein HA402_006247 [Bradysia odoriphaga]